MKKRVFLICFLILPVIFVMILMIIRYANDKYFTISLTEDPDYVFTSVFNNNLYIVNNDELQIYQKGALRKSIKINNGISRAYLDKSENTLYFIDNDSNFSTLDLNNNTETILKPEVVDFCIDEDLIALVSSDNLLCIHSKEDLKECNNIDNIDSVKDVKNVFLKNGYLLLLDNCGNVYETQYNNIQSCLLDSTKIEELKKIEKIYCGYGNPALSETGSIYYWFGDYYSKSTNPYIDPPSDIAEKLCAYDIDNHCMGASFCVGWKKDGKAYFWGRRRSLYEKSVEYFQSPTTIKGFNNVDAVYAGYSIMYIRRGLDFTAIVL